MIQDAKNDKQFENDRMRWASNFKGFILFLFRLVIIVGICYVILGPVIGIISSSFFSDADSYNPMVYMIPQEPTLYRYELASKYLDYFKAMISNLLWRLWSMPVRQSRSSKLKLQILSLPLPACSCRLPTESPRCTASPS